MSALDAPHHPRRPGRQAVVGFALGTGIAILFGVHVARHWFLSDDYYISLIYARNLVEGNGLVYMGERVEGYTNFLWVLFAAGAMSIGLDPGSVANAIGVASGAAILALLARAGARSSSWSDPWIWIAPTCLALHRTFTGWSTSGLETQFFTLLVLAGSLRFLAERDGARGPYSALLLAAAALTRPEGNLFFALAGLSFALEVIRGGRRSLRTLLLWGALYGVVVGGHLFWRYTYYGYLLPNTFYVKVSGFWWEQSRLWWGMFLRDHHLIWCAPLLLAAVLWRRDARNLLLLAQVGGYAAYLLYIGGDVFEYRLATPMLPALYWLLQEGVRALHERWAGWRIPAKAVVPLTATVAGLVVLGAWAPLLRGFEEGHGIRGLENIRDYAEQRVEEGRFLRRLVDEGLLTGDEVLAVGGAGALPYFSRLETVDFRGLNDETVAHLPSEGRGWVGHEKAAPFDYLVQRGVVLWDVKNRIVRPSGSPRPVPHRVDRDFYQGGVCAVEVHGRYLVFATTLRRRAFMQTFSRFKILFYSPARG